MSKAVTAQNKSYLKLFSRVKEEIDSGRRKIEHARALTYRNVGKIIDEDILKNAKRAGYGEKLCARLGRDLGMNKRTIYRAVQFYREYPIVTLTSQLSWTHYTELLSISNKIQRRQFENRAIAQNLSCRALREEIVANKISGVSPLSDKYPKRSGQTPSPQLISQKGALYIYQAVSSDSVKPGRGEVLIDCGFNVIKVIKRAELKSNQLVTTRAGMSYTYKAFVEKVVDGDTLWTLIDLGFNNYTRQKLRLRGINCPELDSADGEGRRAKRFVQNRLRGLESIILKTEKDTADKYDRYLADIFYGEEEKLLNQELLDERLATIYS